MMTFERELTPEQREMVKELMGQPEAEDGRQFLFNRMREIDSKSLSKIARETGQVTTVEFPDDGKIVTMRDGTRYQVTRAGWRRL